MLLLQYWGKENVNGKAVRHLHLQLLSDQTHTPYQIGACHRFLNATQMMYAEAKNPKQRLEVPGMSRLPASSLNVCNVSAQDTIAVTVSSHNQLDASIWQELQSLCPIGTRA